MDKEKTIQVETPGDFQNIVKEESTLKHISETLEINWTRFITWVKHSIAMMIVFTMIGTAGGLYIAKWIYDFRMGEIAQLAKTGVAGYVYNNQVYDVKLRP